MKTTDNFLHEIFGIANWEFGEFEQSFPEEAEHAKDLLKSYVREAIKADRENVAKNAKTTPGNPRDFEFTLVVDKDSIINAPEIELL